MGLASKIQGANATQPTPLTGHSLGSTATYSSTSWDSTANSGYPETAPPSGSQTYNQYNWPSRIDADSHSAVNNFGGSQQDVTETPYGAGHHQHWQSQPLWPVQQQLDNWQQYEGNRGSQMYQDLSTAAANGQQYGGYGGSQMHQYSNAAPGPAVAASPGGWLQKDLAHEEKFFGSYKGTKGDQGYGGN